MGQRIQVELLKGERAAYGAGVVSELGTRLASEFRRGFESNNLHRMRQFARAFPEAEIVATLSRQLSWSHMLGLLPLKSAPARQC